MPVFQLHLRHRTHVQPDDTGVEFRDRHHAYLEVFAAIPTTARDLLLTCEDPMVCAYVICDENGQRLWMCRSRGCCLRRNGGPERSTASVCDPAWKLQRELVDRIAVDPAAAAFVTPDYLDFSKRFLVAVDTLSLKLCWGVEAPVEIGDVPISLTETTQIVLHSGDRGEVVVDPWPFGLREISVSIEGLRFRPGRHRRPDDRSSGSASICGRRDPCSQAL